MIFGSNLDGNISERLKFVMMSLIATVHKDQRKEIEPEDFLLAAMPSEEGLKEIFEKYQLDLEDTLSALRAALYIKTEERKNFIDDKRETRPADTVKLNNISMSNRLNIAFELASRNYSSSYIHPLKTIHIIHSILDNNIIDREKVIGGEMSIIRDIEFDLIDAPDLAEIFKLENNKSNKTNPKKKILNRPNLVKNILLHINKDGENIKSLSLAMARLAKFELETLKAELPNSPEAMATKDSKIELMNLFISGFERIAADIELIDKKNIKNKEKAVASVVSLSDAITRWWEKKNQNLIDVAIGMPVLAGAAVTLKYCGVDPIIQHLLIGSTAVSIYGKETVETAIKVYRGAQGNEKSKK